MGEERRKVLVYQDAGEATSAQVVRLRHPKTGAAVCYLACGDSLQELHWYKQSTASWLIGESVCEDGSLFLGSPVDPLFLLLPVLDEARFTGQTSSRSKRRGDAGGDEGVFRSLEDILFVQDFPAFAQLEELWKPHLPLICQTKQAGDTTYYRLEPLRADTWLKCKVQQTSSALGAHGGAHLAGLDQASRDRYAAGLLAEYLAPTKWFPRLCTLLGFEESEVSAAAQQRTSLGHSVPDLPAMVSPPPPATTTPKTGGSNSAAAKRKAEAAKSTNKITSFFSRNR